MNSVYDRLGKTVRRGKGLRPVLRHARASYVNVVTCKPDRTGDTYSVTFHYADGAYCSTTWADWRVLCDWLSARRSWSVTRVTFDRKLERAVIADGAWDPRVKALQARGTIVTLHAYQD